MIILFILCYYRRRSKKLRSMHQVKSPLPIVGLPVNCCAPTPSPNGPLGSLATLQAYNSHKVKVQTDTIPNGDKFRRLTETENLI